MRAIIMMSIAITLVCGTLISGPWAAGLPDISEKLKSLQPNTDYKITDIVGKKLTVSDPAGAKTTFDGVDTKGLKVGDVLKGSELRDKLAGQIPSMGKGTGSVPESMPKGWK